MDFAKQLMLAASVISLAALAAVVVHRRKRAACVRRLLGQPCQASLTSLAPAQFSACVYELFRREGRAPRRVHLGNRNLMLARTAHGTALVQCRFWTAALLSDNQLQDITRKMRKRGARRGILVTAGAVDENLASRATAAGVELVDGDCVLRRFLALGRSDPN